MIRIDNNKLQWFIKQGDDNYVDLNSFKSLFLYMQQLDTTRILLLKFQFQNLVEN